MFLRERTEPLDQIWGIGPSLLQTFAAVGITSAAALLGYYPRDYEDRRVRVPIRDFHRAKVWTTAKVTAHDWFGFGRMRTLKVYVEDETGRAALVCINRNFLEKQLVIGNHYRIYGRFYYKYGEIQSTTFDFEPAAGMTPGSVTGSGGFGALLPVYPLPEKLRHEKITQKTLRRFIKSALELYAADLEDELPAEIIVRDGLLSKAGSLRAVHHPASAEELERAKKTLIYEELFYLEVMVGKRALERKTGAAAAAPGMAGDGGLSPLQERLLERLPFSLTPDQTRVVNEINRDMDGSYPMARLLQGDVGSGKTLVSFLAALKAIETARGAEGAGDRGGQAAIMAPTELLARQHAENAAKLLEPLGLRIAFLTGNIKAAGRKELLKNLAAGDIDIVIGTHALFSRDLIYKNLRLVVIDEQHRFGVTQRSLIMTKGERPHLLMMSATPIPRTLALTVFGDMDVSVIRGMPPGRKAIKTHLAKQSNEGKVYNFVRGELAAGRQAYFVYPLIEGGEAEELKDAVSMAERLAREIFPEYPSALIHSKIDEDEKKRIMDAFRRNEIKILVATSVVEVGVDVPNASCMVIEHAERFGLSALHQLRGRVGRGEAQSYCFLVYSDQEIPEGYSGVNPGLLSEEERSKEGKRLMVMLENSDGFVIAEKDLLFRGPGQIAGTEQSGYIRLGISDPVRDFDALVRARADAFSILETDPGFLLPGNSVIARVLEKAPPFAEVAL
ncbi:MAG: ATP-dependent DNA helicase RecG [Treponema sp.]|jgi:ATP-dependent DNA helicase RecG|nr:ATP-dependent DNA helicase RecG [Treponema sp.]